MKVTIQAAQSQPSSCHWVTPLLFLKIFLQTPVATTVRTKREERTQGWCFAQKQFSPLLGRECCTSLELGWGLPSGRRDQGPAAKAWPLPEKPPRVSRASSSSGASTRTAACAAHAAPSHSSSTGRACRNQVPLGLQDGDSTSCFVPALRSHWRKRVQFNMGLEEKKRRVQSQRRSARPG